MLRVHGGFERRTAAGDCALLWCHNGLKIHSSKENSHGQYVRLKCFILCVWPTEEEAPKAMSAQRKWTLFKHSLSLHIHTMLSEGQWCFSAGEDCFCYCTTQKSKAWLRQGSKSEQTRPVSSRYNLLFLLRRVNNQSIHHHPYSKTFLSYPDSLQ